MPINKKEGESKDEFMGRCIGIEIANGVDPSQAAAICYSKWENFGASASTDFPPAEINFSKVSFDYDDTLSTSRGKELAIAAIERGDDVYIISARSDKEGMLAVADELGIPHSRVYATGSNKAKEEKIKELGIDKHIDNNSDVVDALPGIGYKFGKSKKVIFNEDFDPEIAKQYKEAGFKVHIRSARKIYRKDKKVWNKLKQANLNEDALVFGEVKELDNKYEYDLLLTGADPIIERMNLMGSIKNDFNVLKSIVINNLDEAKAAQDMINEFDMKFVSIKVVYTYELRPDAPPLKEGGSSRPFCETNLGKTYTYDEIQQLSNSHLIKMGINPPDVFQYKGGFYTTPGGKRGPNTTPWCRHQWSAKAILQ